MVATPPRPPAGGTIPPGFAGKVAAVASPDARLRALPGTRPLYPLASGRGTRQTSRFAPVSVKKNRFTAGTDRRRRSACFTGQTTPNGGRFRVSGAADRSAAGGLQGVGVLRGEETK